MLIEGVELEAPAAPLHELLAAGLAAHPDEPALVSAQRRMTWRELEDASLALAGAYLRIGLKRGDRIASLMPNRIALIVHYLACFKAGLVVTPLNYRYTHREIDHALAVSGASALLAHVERVEDLEASELVGSLALGTIGYADASDEEPGEGAAFGRSFDDLLGGRAGRRAAAARALRPGGDLLHLGQHRPGEGRHPHARDAALDDGQRRSPPSN